MNKKSLHRLLVGSCFVLSFLLVSQCFAQSSSATAAEASSEDSKKNSIQYYSKILGGVLDFANKFYVDEIDPKVLYEGAMKGMMEALGDPHTIYMESATFKDLTYTTSGSFGGIGVTITKNPVNTPEKPAYVEVMSPIEDMPAAVAGVQAGDFIIEVDGVSTPELTMNEVLFKLRGKVGTKVELTFLRGANLKFTRTLTRTLIELPTVKSAMINSTGYIRIIEFTPDTAKRFQEALSDFKKKNFTGLIIDLRNNPGGLLTAAVDVADKFIDSGVIVSTKGRIAAQNSEHKASWIKTTMPKNIPIVVIVNKGSASASEILAGALKDNHLAYIIGQNTYGKGSVQQMIPLSDTDGFKLTIARYYSPSDSNIDKIGIPPDLEVTYPAFTEEQEKNFAKLMEEDAIHKYVEAHPDMEEKDIAAAAEELNKTYPFDLRTLRRFIRVEVNHQKHDVSEVYDLDYDIQLNKALEIIKTEDFNTLLKNAKTLKELENERLEKEALKAQETNDKK